MVFVAEMLALTFVVEQIRVCKRDLQTNARFVRNLGFYELLEG